MKGGDTMQIAVIYKILCMIYSQLLRPLVVKAVEDPDEQWDDMLMGILDKLFDYKE
jgi:hypothetical protein